MIYSFRRVSLVPTLACYLGLVAAFPAARAQQPSTAAASVTATPIALELASRTGPSDSQPGSLPDAPSATVEARESSDSADFLLTADPFRKEATPAPVQKRGKLAPFTDNIVLAGHAVPRLTAEDKIVFSLEQSISPFSLAGELVAGGYAHLTNGSPNYGTNSTAFAQRFGAAVARGTSQHLFEQGALSVILHQDPRYYQMGSSQPITKRLGYAITRPLISRTDTGRTTPNFALLGGYLGAAALTKVYYPPPNQGFTETLRTYGGSLGGAALGDVLAEFLPDLLPSLHLSKRR